MADKKTEELIRDLRLFQRMRGMDEEEMVVLIDSLFELETVPYALINEINTDIGIGQIYFYEKESQIRYYYKYPAEHPTPELVACIISDMLDEADLYDDRLKVRLGGERFNEEADDEIDV